MLGVVTNQALEAAHTVSRAISSANWEICEDNLLTSTYLGTTEPKSRKRKERKEITHWDSQLYESLTRQAKNHQVLRLELGDKAKAADSRFWRKSLEEAERAKDILTLRLLKAREDERVDRML